ncbi:hypothetical protein MKW98_032313 [Papaver atlanticum]|uniref:Phytocyanin domain-containing protein n=1 Tax=Papaver atlanticum TaxID=357466 RepID=A0AAD4XDD1_9MAGN|nr:hypothetical protein MKW98_032313 [Papaver atlanticum]
MGVNKKFLFFLVLLVNAAPLMVNVFVWNVGDDAGWSGQDAHANYNYTRWTMIPVSLVGDDGLRFVYDPNTTNNVLEVAFTDYRSCEATSPLVTYNTGNDTIPITKLHQYFISGNHVYCNNGLKVDIPAYNSSLVKFWSLSGPTYDPDGYAKIPNFWSRVRFIDRRGSIFDSNYVTYFYIGRKGSVNTLKLS